MLADREAGAKGRRPSPTRTTLSTTAFGRVLYASGSGESDTSDFEEKKPAKRKGRPQEGGGQAERREQSATVGKKKVVEDDDDEEMEEADEEGSIARREFDKSVSKKVAAAKVKKEKKVHEEAENRPVPEGKSRVLTTRRGNGTPRDLKIQKWTDEATDELPVLTQPAECFMTWSRPPRSIYEK